MTMEDYKNEVIAYDKYERKNVQEAKKAGLDKENMTLIVLRLEWLKEEFKQFEEAEEENEDEEME